MLRILRNIFLSLAIVVLSFGVGYRAGINQVGSQPSAIINSITGKTQQKPENIDFTLFWDVWDRLNRYYIDKKALVPQKMLDGAIFNITYFSQYLPPLPFDGFELMPFNFKADSIFVYVGNLAINR